jgi:DNA ligase (NAD+)
MAIYARKEENLDANKLARKLLLASEAYYNSGTSTMSDDEFDKLRAQLEEIDPNHPFLKQIGAPLPKESHLTMVKHKIPMGSLNNSNNAEEYEVWHNKHGLEVVAMHKMDGSSIEIIYDAGDFKQAITRGDGFEGEDVTKNVIKFKNVPMKLSKPFTGSVRGEAVLDLKSFAKHFPGQANARNTANGTVRRKSGENTEHLSFIAFDAANGVAHKTHSDKLAYLAKLGFEVVPYEVCKTAKDVIVYHKKRGDNRDKLLFEIDGVVVRINDEAAFQKLGERSQKPKGATAFKFKSMGGTTKLVSVDLSVGTNGAIIPTANLEPLQIGGVTIRRALLNNFEEIEKLKVQIGDEVKVIRAGDVIPKIIGVARPGDSRVPIKQPTQCPHCGSKIIKDGAHIFCRNDGCKAQEKRRLKKWIDKRNIKFLGDSLIDYLYDNGIVTLPHHLYSLTAQQLEPMPSGNGKVGRNSIRIMEQIELSKSADLNEFMGSLAIAFLGRSESKYMIEAGVDTLEKFRSLTIAEAVNLPRFSDTKAEAVVEGIAEVSDEIDALLAAGVHINTPPKPRKEKEVADNPVKGKSFVFTGKIERTDGEGKRYTRSRLQDLAIDLGGKCPSSVGAGVDYLVQADPTSQSSKSKKAEKLGVKMLSEADFFKMVGM